MFFLKCDGYELTKMVSDPQGKNCYLPIEVDTEFHHPPFDINTLYGVHCISLTAQCRSIVVSEGVIFAHPDLNQPRHQVFKTDFVVADYLEVMGYDVELFRCLKNKSWSELPWICVMMVCFFGVAEIGRVFTGRLWTDIRNLMTDGGRRQITQGRKLSAQTNIGDTTLNWVETDWILKLNGVKYRFRLGFIDCCGVYGITSYKTSCEISGVELEYKDVFTAEDKAKMGEMYHKRPEDFDNYALGDLYNSRALKERAAKFKRIYEDLGLSEYYEPPGLTIGTAIAHLIDSSLLSYFPKTLPRKVFLEYFCTPNSAEVIKQLSTSTAQLNAKVHGGRCRNNRPTHTYHEGVICDIDISGCYGEGLRVQEYPLGRAFTIEYPKDSNINKYLTLRQFLKKYGGDLVDGLWQCVISLKDGYRLKYPQDFFISWIPPKKISEMPTDTDYQEDDNWWDVSKSGLTKIFRYEIKNAVLTHDGLEWIEHTATPQQRAEMLDNLYIITAMMYSANDRVDSIEELLAAYENHKGVNTCDKKNIKEITSKVSIDQECYKWYPLNMGEMLVTKLLLERKKYPKKTPFNDLYKLCVNTCYGDMVSPYFPISNVVVGNNITARARTMAWYMEKGLYGWQTITDGCAFDLNQVMYPKRTKISGINTVDCYAQEKFYGTTFKPLANKDPIRRIVLREDKSLEIFYQDSEQLLSPQQANDWIAEAALNHLRNIFPKASVLNKPTTDIYNNKRTGVYLLEPKSVSSWATFHGTANYMFDDRQFKMRGYSKKDTIKLDLSTESSKLVQTESNTSTAYDLLLSLKHPDKVERLPVYIKQSILKVSDYKKNYKTKYEKTKLYPGCELRTASLLREFSLGQFTFNTYEQYKSWEREWTNLIKKYAQSYEMFFLNPDGTLNYLLMVTTIDKAIREDKQKYKDRTTYRKKNLQREVQPHKNADILNKAKANLAFYYRDDDSKPQGIKNAYQEDNSQTAKNGTILEKNSHAPEIEGEEADGSNKQ